MGSVAFSPDGQTLASASFDHTIRLWDLTDSAQPSPLGQPLQGHTDVVKSVAFSPDGHTLISASADHTIRLWPTSLAATVPTLCSKLTSNISRQDWHDWISSTIGYIALCPQPARPTDLSRIALPRDSGQQPDPQETTDIQMSDWRFGGA